MRCQRFGFTILELSVSLAIIGLMLSGALTVMTNVIDQQAQGISTSDLNKITDAIKAYRARTGRLPCPASYTTIYGSAEYGRQVNNGDCSYTVAPAGTTRVETQAGNEVWVLTGAVPVRDLLLRDDFLKDQYGNRITYSVTQFLTSNTTFSDYEGVISINDAANAQISTEAAFVLISHGKDGKGAYRQSTGTLKAACGASTNLDVENCDGDTVFRDATYNDGSVEATYNDDPLLWKTKYELFTKQEVLELLAKGVTAPTMLINGLATNDNIGYSAASTCDLNDDGIDDIVFSAPNADPGGATDAGSIFVLFGKESDWTTAFDLSTLDGSNGFSVTGAASDRSGQAGTITCGDLNDDGRDDLVFGSTTGVRVVFGRGSWTSSINVSTLDGTNGFTVTGTTSENAIGDVNGDGNEDLIVARNNALWAGHNFAGRTYVIFGKPNGWLATAAATSFANGTAGFSIWGVDASDFSGSSVASGDVNNDGFADVIIGAWQADPNGQSAAGESYVVFGKANPWASSLDLELMTVTDGVKLNGISAGEQSGAYSPGARDINGDGVTDIIIDANGASPNGAASGRVYIVYGKSTGWANMELSALNGTNGITINGALTNHNTMARALGDINGDGKIDIAAATSTDTENWQTGRTYFVLGGSSLPATIELSTLGGIKGFSVNGIDQFDLAMVKGMGDFNNDGYDDAIIGAANADPNGVLNAGEVYILFGRPGLWSASTNIADLLEP